MIVYRVRATAAIAAVVALTACRGLAPASGPPSSEAAASAEASTAATNPDEAATVPTETPQPSQCFLGGGIEQVPSDIRELARFADAIVIAEVVDVGELQYSTESGERPSCEYVQAAQGAFAVGRMIELREQRNVAGRARAAASTFTYWLRGGTLAGDTSPPHHFGLDTPEVGDRMLAFLLKEPADMDVGSGLLQVDAYELFAIGKDGRIHTPSPGDVVTTDNIDEVVNDAVPTSPPGG